ncbi:MAG: ribosome silencing factor [Opitutaceae bacterium]|jgi:ribosome-associated protein|nr:ribosome silencing factor [Opitutaceae bacterium]
MKSKPSKLAPPPPLLKLVCRALNDKKAEDMQVFDVGKVSSLTDYLVIATCTSEPHLRALRVELEKVIDASGARIIGQDAVPGSGWLVVDAFDVMVHVLTEQNRTFYALEKLWADAEAIPLARVLESPGAKKTPAKKTPAKKMSAKKSAATKSAGAAKGTAAKVAGTARGAAARVA